MSAPTARQLLAEALGAAWVSGVPFEPSGMVNLDRFAHAILASPALDAIVAGRVAALAEDEAALSAVWDAMESHGHNGVECRPEKPMDYTAVYVIHALATALTERRSSDG